MRRGVSWRAAGIAGALLLSFGGILAWSADPDAIFGLQGTLWLASIALLIASCARLIMPGGEANPDPPWTRAEAIVFIGLVALALLTYTANLQEIPWRFHNDELDAYAEAMRFYSGPPISLFTTTWWGTGLPSLFFAFAGGLMRFAGTELGGVRLGVALFGAFTVIPIYGLARLAWGRAAALLAASAWDTTAVAVHYGRVSIINMTTAFAWAVCFYFLLRAGRSRRAGDFAWAGIAAGLSMYTYYGARLLPFVFLVYVGYMALFHRRVFRETLGGFGLLAAGFVVGFGPLLAYFLRYPDVWAGRGLGELNVPAIIPTTWDGIVADWNALAPVAWKNFLGLSVLPAHDSVYWAPFLLPVQAALLLLGTVLLLWRWRQPEAFLVALWEGAVMLVGGTLVGGQFAPAFNHWIPAFPAFFLAIALPPALLLSALRRASRRAWVAGCVLVAVGMAGIAAANAYTYLVTYPRTVPPSEEAAQGRFLAALGPEVSVRFVGNSAHPYMRSVAALLAPDVPAADFLNPSRSLPVPGDPAHDLVFVFYDDEREYLSVVEGYYPGGEIGQIGAPGGARLAYTYRVLAASAISRHGVLLTVALGDGRQWQVPSVGALPPGLAVHYPLTALWSGAVFVPRPGPVRLQVVGAGNALLQVDGAPGGPLIVDAGWLPFSVRAKLDGPTPLRLLLQEGDGPVAEVTTARLWPQPTGAGLEVTLAGSVVAHRVDPFVGASVLSGPVQSPRSPYLSPWDPELLPLARPTGGPMRITWTGELDAEGGRYTMGLRTDARARLLLDGAAVVVCNNRPGSADDTGRSAEITLAAGRHRVEIEMDATGRANGIEWTWTLPDGVREIVPPDRLSH